VSISPKLHNLLHHAPAYMERLRRFGLHREQAAEFWHGFHNKNAAEYSAGTEVGSCAELVRAMAAARETSVSNLVRATSVTTRPAYPTQSGGRRARPCRRVVLSGNTRPGRKPR